MRKLNLHGGSLTNMPKVPDMLKGRDEHGNAPSRPVRMASCQPMQVRFGRHWLWRDCKKTAPLSQACRTSD